MTVGIVTLFGDNFGNKLQNLAMQILLEHLGCQAQTVIVSHNKKIHHRSNFKTILCKLNPFYVFKVLKVRFKNRYHYKNDRDGVIGSVLYNKHHNFNDLEEKRSNRYKEFTSMFLKLSEIQLKAVQEKDPRLEGFDVFVCGSDQIWNPTYPSTSAPYFLAFAPSSKRIAFAASFGLSKLPEHVIPIYKKWIGGIPYLSVREEKGAEIVEQLTGYKPPVLPDPTLCVPKVQWEKIERKPQCAPEGGYVLTYFLGNETKGYRKYIERYAASHNYKVVNLLDIREPAFYTINPAEFLWLIHHAKAMMTDSFHGTVFSLIYHIPFLVFERVEEGGAGMNSRIDTLLKSMGMDGRRYMKQSIEEIDNIDFENVDSQIDNLSEQAMLFLSESLEKASNTVVRETENFSILDEPRDCTGCGACYNACPVGCISMNIDADGFKYPYIDTSRCIRCNKCKNVCPVLNPLENLHLPSSFISFNTNSTDRKKSSSGGMFSAFAKQILSQGGIVYGAGFDQDFYVKQIHTENERGSLNLQGSKYVQSDTGDAFKEVKTYLDNGRTVYYAGTPCQIEALLSFLGRQYSNLYTQDFICHGVPSPAVWRAYMNHISKGKQIKHISFRDKSYGWHYFSMSIETSNHRYCKRLDEDIYLRLFLDNITLRPSCYNCKFKKIPRCSDITLGDCWNKGVFNSNIKDDDKGLSLIFVNSDKGKALFNSLKDKILSYPVETDIAISSQSAIKHSVIMPAEREYFFANAAENGFEEAVFGWYDWNPVQLLKKKIYYYKFYLKKFIINQ